MHRIDTPNAADGLFVEGTGSTSKTVASPEWLTALQEELLYVIEEQGLSPDKQDTTQLRAAIVALILLEIGVSDLLGAFDTFVAPVAVSDGDPVYLANANGYGTLVVAAQDAGIGEPFLAQVKGNAVLPKDATPGQTTFVQGQAAFWDTTTDSVHDNNAANRYTIGYAREARGFLDTTVEIRLNGTPGLS